MTKEEILKMEPGRELDALIAEKVMEIKLHWDDEEGQSYKIADSPFGEVLKAFNPSTDISAAWEVLEQFKTHQVTKSETGFSHSEKKYRVIVGKNQNVAYADTVPEAICKAALLACLEGK